MRICDIIIDRKVSALFNSAAYDFRLTRCARICFGDPNGTPEHDSRNLNFILPVARPSVASTSNKTEKYADIKPQDEQLKLFRTQSQDAGLRIWLARVAIPLAGPDQRGLSHSPFGPGV